MTAAEIGWLVLLAPVLPVLLAGLAAAGATRRLLPALCLVAPLPALVLALIAPEGVGIQLPWLLLETRLGVDATGRAFLLLFSMLWLIASWHAFFYLRKDHHRSSFAFWFLLAMAGNIGTAVAQDALAFYAAFAVMSFASYGLVVHDRQPQSMRAGRVYIILVVVGELALFAGILLGMATTGGSFDGPSSLPSLALILLALGFSIKAGLVPLHFWLPLAHPAAPAPASAVLSGAMIKVGLLGALRFMPLPLSGAGELLIGLGAVSAIFGVVLGVLQTNPKALLAYSSISQMGLVAIGFGLALTANEARAANIAITATILFALHHGFAKAALFLGSVCAPARFGGSQRLLRLVALLLPATALAGAPLTSGAIAKTALKTVEAGPGWVDLFLSLSSAATSVLLVRFLALMWRSEGEEKPGTLAPLLVGVLLSSLTLWLWPQTAAFLGYSINLSAIVSSLVPVLSGGAVGVAAAYFLRAASKPVITPGDILHLFDPAKALVRLPRPTAASMLTLFAPAFARAAQVGADLATLERKLQVWRVGAVFAAALATLLLICLI